MLHRPCAGTKWPCRVVGMGLGSEFATASCSTCFLAPLGRAPTHPAYLTDAFTAPLLFFGQKPPHTYGQDDAVTLWCLETRACVLRGEGHGSWVTGVAFDYWTSRQPYYRFTSVGEDARLCM